MKYKNFQIMLLLTLIISLLNSCSIINKSIALLKSTNDFITLKKDNRILYESGADNLADSIAFYLPKAIDKIENEQFHKFVKPIKIYVCKSEESFSDFTGVSKEIRGAVTLRKLFISGKLNKFPYNNSINLILTHELSHLHLQQLMGSYNFSANLPTWFQEGLAVLISDGGGAESISETEAIQMLKIGKHFIPNLEGNFWFPKYGNNYGLRPQMFYKQSEMFVSYLRTYDEESFKKLLSNLITGKNFKDSFTLSYNENINEIWNKFIKRICNGV